MGGGVFMFLKVSWLWLSASLPIQTDLKESNSFGAVSDSAYHGRNIAPAAIGNQHYTDSAVYYEYRSIIGDTQWIPASSGLIQIGSEDKDRQQIELRVREGTKTSKPVRVKYLDEHTRQEDGETRLFWNLLHAVMLVFSLLILFQILKLAKSSRRIARDGKRIMQLELQTMQNRMNPHFVFNVITAIQNFITQGREQEANYYTAQFSRLIRQSFQDSSSIFNRLSEELQLLNIYLDLERMRFDNKIDYLIEVDPELSPEELFIPSMLIQPFLENAIKHGVRTLSDEHGRVTLRVKRKNQRNLLVEIEDNGIGINKSARLKKEWMNYSEHQSAGIQMVRNRIELMNLCFKMNMKLDIVDLTESGAGGTLITLVLPMIKTDLNSTVQ